MSDALFSDALAVRGGLMADIGGLREQATDQAADDDDELALSVWCAGPDKLGGRREAILHVALEAPIPNRQLRVASTRALIDRGPTLVHRPPPPCHWHVILGTVDAVEQFEALFGPPEPNPRYQ